MFVSTFRALMAVDRSLVCNGLRVVPLPASSWCPSSRHKSLHLSLSRLPCFPSQHRLTALAPPPAPSSLHAAIGSFSPLSLNHHSLLLGTSLPTPTPPSLPSIEQLDELVYQVSQWANDLLVSSLSFSSSSPDLALGQSALLAALVAGLATSLSPCTISVLPLTVGYIAGVEPGKSQSSVSLDAFIFVAGLATTRVTMGVAAALAGKLYGRAFGDELGFFLPLLVAAVALAMGLNLLGLLNVRLPSFLGDFDATEAAGKLPRPLQMYLAGLAFALVASPCATPVLASLLAFVAATKDVYVGSTLLLLYTLGSTAPLLAAASFTGAMKQLLSLRSSSAWLTPVSGCLLLAGGTYSLLDHLVPMETTGTALQLFL